MTKGESHSDETKAKIVSSEAKAGVIAASNGSKAQGRRAHYASKERVACAGELDIAEVHIEAPCCRDIHGKEPPDGGVRAWLVMVSAFVCNGVIFGFINTYGIIHSLLTDRLEDQGDTDASSKAALVGSLAIGTTFLLSPVAGCLTDKIGLRMTTFIGGVLAAGGLFLSSFCTQNISALYLTYGIMFGLGAALAYTPTIAILGHYFKRYLGKVSGFVTAGSSVFTVILPPGLDFILKGYGLETTLQIMSLIACFVILCSFVYKPLHPPPQPPEKKPGRSRLNIAFRSIINVHIWKRKRYVIWALCVPLALFGYFVPYVHMMKFVQNVFPGESENLPVMCIGITSGIGRLIFGVIADLPGVNRIYLQQISLISIGVVTLLLPLTNSYIVLLVFTLIMGLFDGCFISLLGPIAYEICGPTGATQAIGFLLGFSSIPLTVGPPVAGIIYDKTGSYTIPLILAGIPPIVGASVMILIRFVRDEKISGTATSVNGSSAGKLCSDNDSNGALSIAIERRETMQKSDSSNETEEKLNDPLLYGNDIVKTTGGVNGTAHLAHSGTNSLYSVLNIIPVVDTIKQNHACACGESYLLNTNDTVSSRTALLTTGCLSTLVGECSLPVQEHSSEAPSQKRRYSYSVY